MTEYFKKDGEEFVKVEDELLTTEQVNSVVRERAKRIVRNDYGDYDELKQKASQFDKSTSEYEDKLKALGDEKSELEGKLKSAQVETIKVKAVHDFKLSDELAEFINGDDEATIRQQAEKLSQGVSGGSVKIDKTKKPDEKASDTKKAAQSLFGKKSDD